MFKTILSKKVYFYESRKSIDFLVIMVYYICKEQFRKSTLFWTFILWGGLFSMKKFKFFVTALLLGIGFSISLKQTPVEASKPKATKVKAHYKHTKKNKYYMVLTGYTKKNKKVWSHKSGKYESAQIEATSYRKKGKYVYFFDGRKLKVYKLSSGKKLLQKKTKIAGGHSFTFDSKYNLYLTGYLYDDIYKLDKKGRTKWNTNIKHLGLGDAYGTTYKRGVLTIYYESSPLGGDLDIDKHYYVKLDAKTGKILSYQI